MQKSPSEIVVEIVLVESCPSEEFSWWGIVLVGNCPGGKCPSEELTWWEIVLVSCPGGELS